MHAFRAMDFCDDTHGWFASAFKLFRTDDSGRNWREIPVPCGKAPKTSISAPTERFCAVLTEGLEYVCTCDGGKSWQNHRVADGLMAARLVFATERNGWLLAKTDVQHPVARVLARQRAKLDLPHRGWWRNVRYPVVPGSRPDRACGGSRLLQSCLLRRIWRPSGNEWRQRR